MNWLRPIPRMAETGSGAAAADDRAAAEKTTEAAMRQQQLDDAAKVAKAAAAPKPTPAPPAAKPSTTPAKSSIESRNGRPVQDGEPAARAALEGQNAQTDLEAAQSLETRGLAQGSRLLQPQPAAPAGKK